MRYTQSCVYIIYLLSNLKLICFILYYYFQSSYGTEMKKIIILVVAMLLLTLPLGSLAKEKLSPTTTNFNPWCHIFDLPYETLYDFTIKGIKESKRYQLFDASKAEHFIYCVQKGEPFVRLPIRFFKLSKNSTKVVVMS